MVGLTVDLFIAGIDSVSEKWMEAWVDWMEEFVLFNGLRKDIRCHVQPYPFYAHTSNTIDSQPGNFKRPFQSSSVCAWLYMNARSLEGWLRALLISYNTGIFWNLAHSHTCYLVKYYKRDISMFSSVSSMMGSSVISSSTSLWSLWSVISLFSFSHVIFFCYRVHAAFLNRTSRTHFHSPENNSTMITIIQ